MIQCQIISVWSLLLIWHQSVVFITIIMHGSTCTVLKVVCFIQFLTTVYVCVFVISQVLVCYLYINFSLFDRCLIFGALRVCRVMWWQPIHPSVSLSVTHGWISQKRLKLGLCSFYRAVTPSIPLVFVGWVPEILTSSPEWGCQTREGRGTTSYFLALCISISKTVRNTSKVNTNH